MPPAAQPHGVSNALGLMYRRVRVEQVVVERGMAIVRDEQGFTTEIPYRVQSGRGRLPREGDYWYVDRSMGPWIFSVYIATDDADINHVEGNMTVSGDFTTEGGALVGKGLFIEEGASVGTGLFVGDGAHVVGQLHSVAGISTPGPITADGGIILPQGKYAIRGPAASPSFQNGWGNYGAPFQTVRFIEYPDGTAGLIGVANGGTVTDGTVLFNLPTHLRPDGDHTFLCPSGGGTTMQIRVNGNGNVATQLPDPGASWVALSGCRWPVASAY